MIQNSRVKPTLMMANINIQVDYHLIQDFVSSFNPTPIHKGRGISKNYEKQQLFFKYSTFNEAQYIRRLLNGQQIPGCDGLVINLNFIEQCDEVSIHVSSCSQWMTEFDFEKIFEKYPSSLGLSNISRRVCYNSEKLTFFVRFLNFEDCIQAVQELRNYPIDDRKLCVTFSFRNVENLKKLVEMREVSKIANNTPSFQNLYTKRLVTQEELNQSIIDQDSFFDDLENSRWSPIVFRHSSIDEFLYYKSMVLDHFSQI